MLHAAPEPNTGLPAPLNSPCNNNQPPLTKKPPRSKIHPQLVKAARTKTLDEIMNLVGQDSKYSQLTAENQLQLNAVYMEYQRQLYLVAYENKLAINPCLTYVGKAFNPQVSTNYNSFCRYDPVASKCFNDSAY
jgi:hypothetical protein